MATFIVFGNFTDQGIRNIKDSPKRAKAFGDMAKKLEVTVKDIYWTQGCARFSAKWHRKNRPIETWPQSCRLCSREWALMQQRRIAVLAHDRLSSLACGSTSDSGYH